MNRITEFYWKFRFLSYKYGLTHNLPLNKEKKRVFIFLAADYGNLGDVAITYAQKKYLKEKFKDAEVLEVPAGKTLRYLKAIKRQIHPDDIVTVVGGGNMGDMYFDIELLRLLVVKEFKNNKIILFPQTIDYSNSVEAQKLLELSKKIYSSAPCLTMYAREKMSFSKMMEYYPGVDIRLSPDIVMSLDERLNLHRDDVAILCLRDDMEKANLGDIKTLIQSELIHQGFEIKKLDTHIGDGRFSEEEKYRILKNFWEEFSKARLIITDRLHGMIFAYITGTPALVLPNNNFKIRESYEWIKDCGYINFVNFTTVFNTDKSLSITSADKVPSVNNKDLFFNINI